MAKIINFSGFSAAAPTPRRTRMKFESSVAITSFIKLGGGASGHLGHLGTLRTTLSPVKPSKSQLIKSVSEICVPGRGAPSCVVTLREIEIAKLAKTELVDFFRESGKNAKFA